MALRSPLRVQDIDLSDFELFVQGKAHEVWRLLRAEAPVHWNAGNELFPGFWSVTQYADVLTVSRDTTTYSSSRGISMMVDPDNPTPASGAKYGSTAVMRAAVSLSWTSSKSVSTSFAPLE